MLPRDPRGMREGVGELVFSAHAFQLLAVLDLPADPLLLVTS
jgi:hypothetical protein